MNKLSYIVAVSFIFLISLGCAKPVEDHSKTGIDFVMNTFVEQRWHGENSSLAYTEILEYLKEQEQALSLFIEDSEISKLNKNAGKEAVVLSNESYELLSRAVEISKMTDGAFDVTIAPLSKLWNVNDENPIIPSERDIIKAKQKVSFKSIELDEILNTAFLTEDGMAVDIGAIAKGNSAEVCLEIAKKHEVSGFVSIGGNIAVNGVNPEGKDFSIGIRDPRGDVSDIIATVNLDGKTMATTGDYERYFMKDGIRYHHIIDPFTGYPVASEFMSVTVISADGTLADALSTAIFIEGIDCLTKYFDYDDIIVVAITHEKEVLASHEFWDTAIINSENNEYKFCR